MRLSPWILAVALIALIAPQPGHAVLQYGEDCQTVTLEGSTQITDSDLESDPLVLPLDVCARGTANVTMDDGLVQMEDLEVGFYADPGQSLNVELFERDSPGEDPSLIVELLLLDFAFLLLQNDASQGSPSGSSVPADLTAEGKMDFEFTGELAPQAGPLLDGLLTTLYGEPLFPASEFNEPVNLFIETTPGPLPSLHIPSLLYVGPFNLLMGIFQSQITIRAPRPFELMPAGGPPPICDPAPRNDCNLSGRAKLSVKEKSEGKEKLTLQLRKLVDPVAQNDLGDPVAGNTRYDVCIYDDADALAGGVGLDRAGDTCGNKPCWQALSDQGYKYTDKAASAGVTQLVGKGGDAGKGQVKVTGRNKVNKGQFALPTGLAAALQGAASATAQLVVEGVGCFGASLTDVKKADGLQFDARTP